MASPDPAGKRRAVNARGAAAIALCEAAPPR
jgi:hypothetical protein